MDHLTSPKLSPGVHCLNIRHKGMFVTSGPDPDEFTFYDKYDSTPDFLNNIVAAFPGTGTVLGSNVQGGQISNRFAGVISLRSQFGSRVTNEWRGGLDISD